VPVETQNPPRRMRTFPDPLPEPELEAMMNELGGEGWELVSVQPFSRNDNRDIRFSSGGLLDSPMESANMPVSVFMGYWFFWKKAVNP
jgi:hypothetical protein